MSADRTGVKFKNLLRESDEFNVLKYGYFYNGGGVSIGDINQDGLPDIYVTGNLVASKLYLNKGNWKFEDITTQAGVAAAGLWNTGTTMADVNGDGWLDIYVCRSAAKTPDARRNLLFLNNGDLTFTEQAASFGIADPGYSTQAAFFDYDRDGDLDLYILNHSVQEYAGFSRLLGQYKNQPNAYYGDRLYRNDLIQAEPGLVGAFTDVTESGGIVNNVLGFGLGIGVADLNRDGWPDLYISNDYNENDYLYINQQNGTFQEQLRDYFDHVSLFSMGSDIGDINNDGLPDVMTLDMLPNDHYRQKMTSGPDNYEKYNRLIESGFHHQTMRNMLQLNQGNGAFAEIGQLSGVSNTDWSWTALFADFDLDGWQDLFITNGYERDYTNMDFLTYAANEKIKSDQSQKEVAVADLLAEMPSIQVPNYIYQNQGNLTFLDKSKDWGMGDILQSNGAAYADLDVDGDLDLVVNNVNDPLALYQNHADVQTDHHFLRVKLAGSKKNTFGVGAEVCIRIENKQQCRTLMPTRGFQAAVEPLVVFGLGADSLIDQLEIRWPDGEMQTMANISADQTLEIAQDAKEKNESGTSSPLWFESIGLDSMMGHHENAFEEFDREPLMPHKHDTQGPKIAEGDLNGDGLADFFIGGAKGMPGNIWLQGKGGTFSISLQDAFEADKDSEDIGAVALDVDGDQDLDLYVVSGGSDFSEKDPALQDRLYLNDGKGRFQKSINALPEMRTSGSCVAPSDWDGDGDMDVFVGGRLVPGRYPTAPRSYLLQNEGSGIFTDVTAELAPGLLKIGMVTDAVWTQLGGSELPDLMLVGEWMPISYWINADTTLHTVPNSSGWWNAIESADMDGDGDADFVLGNMGWNTQIKASPAEPVALYSRDFDENGSLDPIMTYFLEGTSYPMPSRDDLIRQLPYLKNKYLQYEDYANQSIDQIFTADELEKAEVLKAEVLGTVYLEQLGSKEFAIRLLPIPAQVAPVYAISLEDLNDDGALDMVLAGNFLGTRVKFGRYDANHGLVLIGDGKGGFSELPNRETGLSIRGEVRDISTLRTDSGAQIWLFIRNNQPVLGYRLRLTSVN